jgi:hypothetical protein
LFFNRAAIIQALELLVGRKNGEQRGRWSRTPVDPIHHMFCGNVTVYHIQ